ARQGEEPSVMSGQPSRRDPRPRRGNYRELIHLLNRRYHLAWERAERLEVELARARRWGLWPVIELLRRVKRRLRPPAADLPAGAPPGPSQPLVESAGRPWGRISIVIPFRARAELLRNCLRSLRLSTYRRFEIILVNNGSEEPRTQRLLWHLEGRRGVRVV